MSSAEELKKQLAFLECVLENTHEGVVACNELGEIVFINKQARINLHLTDEGMKIPQLYTLDGKKIADQDRPLLRALNGEITNDLDTTLVINGVTKYYRYNARPLKDHSGKIIGAMASGYDVTDSMKTKKELEARFETIFKQSPFSIQLVSKDGKTLMVNKAFQKLWGISDEFIRDYIFKEYNILKDPLLEKRGFLSLFHRALKGEVVEIPEFLYDPQEMSLEGKAAWTKGLVYPIFEMNGAVKELVVVHNEVTQEHLSRTENEKMVAMQNFLSEVTTLLQTTLDSKDIIEKIAASSIPYFADGCIVDVLEGDQIKRLLTKHRDPKKEELMRRLQREYPPKINSPQPSPRVIRSGKADLLKAVSLEEIRERTLDEKHFQLLVDIGVKSHIAVPLEMGGKILGALNFYITTDRKLFDDKDLEMSFELARRAAIAIHNSRLYRDAQNAIKERENFISIASHELKTPITSLKLQWELAARTATYDREEKVDYYAFKKLSAISNRQLARITRLVEDMLDIARINTGRLAMSMGEINLALVLAEVNDRFADQIKDANIDYRIMKMDDTWVMADAFRIEQVMTNIISNAIRYGKNQPIEVTLESKNGQACFSVKDYGEGISPEDQERIFERFVRALSKNDSSGLGLGLYISREIVQEHKGELTVESSPGQGSTFHLRLNLIR